MLHDELVKLVNWYLENTVEPQLKVDNGYVYFRGRKNQKGYTPEFRVNVNDDKGGEYFYVRNCGIIEEYSFEEIDEIREEIKNL